ncbi:MAG: efflux RND transporter periplasmic adaptor subunit [Spirochaetales bacterium]|nr:efflux RND transporter periplasmic adaptor subunit [Spirochaetales bacterium]
MKIRRIVIIAVIIVAATAAIVYIRGKKSYDDNSAASLYIPEKPGIAVEAYRASYGTVIPFVEASGLITGKNEAVLVSETRGVIKKVSADIGSFLKKGDAVLSVDSSVAELSMVQAEQQLKSIQIDYNSVKRAYEGGSASEAELVRSRGQRSGAEAAYEDAVRRFENTVIKAPFDGYLADIESGIGTGNYISEGVRIGQVVDISEVKINLFLGDDEVQRIRKGTRAVIKTASKVFEGRVDAIALSSDRNTGSFRVVITAANPYGEEIRSGFAADVSIDLAENSNAIVIPASAVIEIGTGTWVYLIESNKAILKKVVTGTISGNRIEIISGLAEGSPVITTGFKSLSDGALVIPNFENDDGGTE